MFYTPKEGQGMVPPFLVFSFSLFLFCFGVKNTWLNGLEKPAGQQVALLNQPLDLKCPLLSCLFII